MDVNGTGDTNMMSLHEAAKRLGLAAATVKAKVKKGEISATELGEGTAKRYMFTEFDVNEYSKTLKTQKRNPYIVRNANMRLLNKYPYREPGTKKASERVEPASEPSQEAVGLQLNPAVLERLKARITATVSQLVRECVEEVISSI